MAKEMRVKKIVDKQEARKHSDERVPKQKPRKTKAIEFSEEKSVV